ncbi:hypothetical protein HDU79_002017 [Rhizoclosmatium sp. JEL0117]|nr:hypothetical protein HDU79_002017 [Rhizoclosmatium sp. JEL0117]
MGETQIPEEVYWEYIDSLREFWTADKYHLFDNNCNSFSNEVCQFLVGREIPKHITGLPKEFLSTPFGQQIAPMIEQMFGPSRVAAEHRPQNELLSTIATSTFAGLKHEHDKLNTPNLRGLSKDFILFMQSSDLELIFGKLNGWLNEAGISAETKPVLDAVKAVLKAKYDEGTIKLGPLPANWWTAFGKNTNGLDATLTHSTEKCVATLKPDQLFPLIDILRFLVLDKTVAKSLISQSPSPLILLLARFQKAFHSQYNKTAQLPKALHMMLLRLTCNLFAHSDTVAHILALHLTIPPSTPHRTVTTATLIDALLSPEESVRQCSSSLAFNMAVEAVLGRPKSEDSVYEEWCLEMVAAVVKALEAEKSDEIGESLLKSNSPH